MARRRPPAPTMSERAHLAGLTVVARHGPRHMSAIGTAGQDALSRRIATEYGIPEDAVDYAVRLDAARRLYFSRLRKRRPTPRALGADDAA